MSRLLLKLDGTRNEILLSSSTSNYRYKLLCCYQLTTGQKPPKPLTYKVSVSTINSFPEAYFQGWRRQHHLHMWIRGAS